MAFRIENAERIEAQFANSFHELWRDENGREMLGCTQHHGHGVEVELNALKALRDRGGEFVGLKHPEFTVVVPAHKVVALAKGMPLSGKLCIRPKQVELERTDNAECNYGVKKAGDDCPF
jgi:hypothetical protein